MSSKSVSGPSKAGIGGVLIALVIGVLFLTNILSGPQKSPCAACAPHPTITAQEPVGTNTPKPKATYTATATSTATAKATKTVVPPVPTAPPVVTAVATVPPVPSAQVTVPPPVGTKGTK